MEKIIFTISFVAVTAYLALAAYEDHKTCEVSRWKHLIGLLPALCLFLLSVKNISGMECVVLFGFALLYVAVGYLGVYGIADGFVFANLALCFGSIGGLSGIGFVIVIMILAAFSFLGRHLMLCLQRKAKLFHNVGGAFIPHIFVGYLVTFGAVLICGKG